MSAVAAVGQDGVSGATPRRRTTSTHRPAPVTPVPAADDEELVPAEVVVVGVVELQADSEMAEAARSARPAFIVKCRLM